MIHAQARTFIVATLLGMAWAAAAQAQSADLVITKTDGAATEIPGTGITYTIVASNAGPNAAPGSTVNDTFPGTLTGVTWTCVGAGGGTCTGAGAGNIADVVNLPVGATVTYTVNATIAASATGSLSNTATVTVGGGVTEVNPLNNSATDTDTLTPQANLAITKTDGAATEIPGTSITYTITASNPTGPSNAPGSTVTDNFPGTLTGVTWTCVGAGGGTCTGAGAGNIADAVNLPVGGSVTYTVNATIAASATGSLSNTATVAVGGGVTETAPANNTATDTDTLTPQANLAITKTDGAATEIPGTSITYTITASNPTGPSNAPGSTVTDNFPGTLTGVTWTCVGAGGGTCTGAGAGNISDAVNLPVGGSVTYTVNATINPAALGTLTNTATVATAGGITDTNLANNTASDSDVLTPQADLAIAKSESADPVVAGTALAYTVTVTNNGPSNALTVSLSDTLPASVVFVSAVGCTHDGSPTGGVVTCAIGTIAASANAVRTINTTVLSSVVDNTNISNSAVVSSATPDPGPSVNNVVISTNVQREPDLGVTKTASVDPVIAGTSFTYTVTVTNHGPSDASSVVLTDTLPGEVTFVSAAGCTHDGSAFGGDVTCPIGNLVAGASQIFTITSFVEPCTLPGTIMLNVASLTHNPAETDPGPNANTFNLNTTVTTLADVSVTKTDTPDPALAGTRVTYTVTITNAGPSCARDVSLLDTFGPNTLFQEGFSDISCVDGGTTATCAQGTMTVGQTNVLTLVGKVACDTIDGTLEVNTAVVSSSTPDPDSADLTATATTTIDTLAEVNIEKADAPDPVQPATNLTYSIDVFNDGPSDALGVVVTDPLPAGLSFVSATENCTEVAGTVTCNVGTVPCGKRRQVRIRTRVETDVTSLTNTATASTTTTESDATNNSDTEQTSIRSDGGVQLRLSAAPRALREGGVTSVVYVLRVRNKSLLDSGNLSVTATLPAAVTLSESQPAPTTTNGNVLTYSLGSLDPVETRILVLRAELVEGTAAGTPLVFSASVSEGSVTLDQQTFSGVVRAPGPSQGGALEVDLTTVRRAVAGSKLNATVDVLNTGRKAADDVVVVLTAPAALFFDGATPEPTSVTTVGSQTLVTWDLATVRGPSNTRLKATYRIDAGAAPGATLNLTADVDDADGRSASDAQSIEIRD